MPKTVAEILREYPPITDEEVLRYAQYKIATEHEAKFREGMRKYDSPIMLKDGVGEAFPEAWDLINYLSVGELQKSRALRLLDDMATEYGLSEDPRVQMIFDLLGKKKLAVKKEQVE